MHRDNPCIRAEEECGDARSGERLRSAVMEKGIQVVREEKREYEQDTAVPNEISGMKKTETNDKPEVSPVEQSVMEGEEAGHDQFIERKEFSCIGIAQAAGEHALQLAFRRIGNPQIEDADDGKNADKDALGPVAEHGEAEIPALQEGKRNRDEVYHDQGEKRLVVENQIQAGLKRRDIHGIPGPFELLCICAPGI